MRKNMLRGMAVAASMLFTGAASAATVTVTYDLDNSVLNIATPLAIANAADITGTAVVTFTSDNSGNIIDGAVSLDSVVVNVNLGVGGLASLGLSGTIATAMAAPTASTLTGNSIASASPLFNLNGTINCSPSGACTFLLSMPPSTVLNTTATLALSGATVNPLAAPSHLTASQALSLSIGDLATTGTVLLDGAETGRVFVPEPGTVLLLGMGLAGLAALGRKRA